MKGSIRENPNPDFETTDFSGGIGERVSVLDCVRGRVERILPT